MILYAFHCFKPTTHHCHTGDFTKKVPLATCVHQRQIDMQSPLNECTLQVTSTFYMKSSVYKYSIFSKFVNTHQAIQQVYIRGELNRDAPNYSSPKNSACIQWISARNYKLAPVPDCFCTARGCAVVIWLRYISQTKISSSEEIFVYFKIYYWRNPE